MFGAMEGELAICDLYECEGMHVPKGVNVCIRWREIVYTSVCTRAWVCMRADLRVHEGCRTSYELGVYEGLRG